MFKKTLIVLAIVALSFGLAGLATAAEKGPLSLSVRGNIINSDIFCDSDDVPFESETDSGFGVAVEYDLPWYDLSLEAAVDRLNFYDEVAVGEFDSMDLSLSLKYNFKQLENRKLIPYLLGGIGYMINDYSVYHVDNSFESHIGAGLNYLINDSWSLYAEGRRIWSSADVPDAFAGTGEDRYKVDLDSFIGMAGMKYRF